MGGYRTGDSPLLLFWRGAHTAAVVDFLEVSNHVGLTTMRLIVCNKALFLSHLFYLFKKRKKRRKEKEPFYLNYCDSAFFIKSTHCSLMLVSGLGVNAMRQVFWHMSTVVM